MMFFANPDIRRVVFKNLQETFHFAPELDGVPSMYASALIAQEKMDPAFIVQELFAPFVNQLVAQASVEFCAASQWRRDDLVSWACIGKVPSKTGTPETVEELFHRFCFNLFEENQKAEPKNFWHEKVMTFGPKPYDYGDRTLLENLKTLEDYRVSAKQMRSIYNDTWNGPMSFGMSTYGERQALVVSVLNHMITGVSKFEPFTSGRNAVATENLVNHVDKVLGLYCEAYTSHKNISKSLENTFS